MEGACLRRLDGALAAARAGKAVDAHAVVAVTGWLGAGDGDERIGGLKPAVNLRTPHAFRVISMAMGRWCKRQGPWRLAVVPVPHLLVWLDELSRMHLDLVQTAVAARVGHGAFGGIARGQCRRGRREEKERRHEQVYPLTITEHRQGGPTVFSLMQ